MRFSQRLKTVRKELNLTQDELARACNVKLTAISKYENELIKPAFEMLSKISLAYNINLNWLVNEIGTMFLNSSSRQLLQDGTTGEIIEIGETVYNALPVQTDEHSLNLSNDLKIDFYETDNTKHTEIYRKNGNIEKYQYEAQQTYFNQIMQKIAKICKNKNQAEFLITAVDALENEDALNNLKSMIKGMELSKNFSVTKLK